jgi:uncharacterized repeat protein (TIGR03803 family)
MSFTRIAAIAALLSSVALASCAKVETQMTPPTASRSTPSVHRYSKYAVLYDFQGGANDGEQPESLTSADGYLYGATLYGGVSSSGTIFRVQTSGGERVLHRFSGNEEPLGTLLFLNGALYGTTVGYAGTVFRATLGGKVSDVYDFGSPPDGEKPYDGPIAVKGLLYGTTYWGGASKKCSLGCGTVYKLTADGHETILHSFSANPGDGALPAARPIYFNGALYGTTAFGGSSKDCLTGCGTIFKISLSGKETVVHNFGGNPGDGAEPTSGLIAFNGDLYGVAQYGGSSKICTYGCGVAYRLTSSNDYHVMYNFGHDYNDGVIPAGSLAVLGNLLYGVTSYGGTSYDCLSGCGTIFSLNTSGKERVLRSFDGDPKDGAVPAWGLIAVGGALYGTTSYGGSSKNCSTGCGTVFTLAP